MKKFLSVALAIVMVVSALFCVTVFADANFQGAGIEGDPFLISTAADLTKLSTLTNHISTNAQYGAAHYKLTADIDMTGATFDGLNCIDAKGGDWNYKYFSGSFDGDGHIITNLTITTTASRPRGFISMANGATVKNLGFEKLSVTGGSVGGIIGQDMNGSTIDNCYVKGFTGKKLQGHMSIAAFVSCVDPNNNVPTVITNSYALNLTADTAFMGADGTNYRAQATITNCYTDHAYVASFSGRADKTVQTNCYSSANIAEATADKLGDAFYMAAGSDFPALKVFAYHVTVSENENADVTLSSEYVLKGKAVTATVTAKPGYKVTKVTVNGEEYVLNDAGEVSFVPASNSVINVETEAALPALGTIDTLMQDAFAYDGQTYTGKTFITYVTVKNYNPGLACGVKMTYPGTGAVITLPASEITNDGSFAVRVFGDGIEENEELSEEDFEAYIG